MRSCEIVFWVSLASDSSSQQWNAWIRGHWRIENHYVRDATFAEDASRIRKNPDIAAIAVTSDMLSKGSGSRRGVSVYDRSLRRTRKSPEGLNVTMRRAETVAEFRSLDYVRDARSSIAHGRSQKNGA